MANHPESPLWVPVYQRERTDLVDAGVDGTGVYNTPIIHLVRRTGYLKALTDELIAARASKPILGDRFGDIETKLSTSVRIFGGQGGEGDYTLNSGTATFDQGEYYFRNFTIGGAATLIVDKGVYIHCSGTASVAGTVQVNPYSLGGGSVIVTSVRAGGTTGTGPGAGSGFTPGTKYPYGGLQSPQPGSGGAQGRMLSIAGSNGVATAEVPQGGSGGGYFVLEVSGAVTITGTILALGDNGGAAAPTDANATVSGAGGGSGGNVTIASLTSILIAASATINVRGGNGGAGSRGSVSGSAYGGGAGAGGYFVLMCPSVTQSSSNILLTAGSPGANIGTITGGSINGVGGGGFGGNGGFNGAGAIAAQPGQLVIRPFLPVA